jgi:hypothetical protein
MSMPVGNTEPAKWEHKEGLRMVGERMAGYVQGKDE